MSGRVGVVDVAVTETILTRLRDEAARAHPDETCGIFLGRDGQITQVCTAANVHPTPATRFEIDPQALVDAWRAARVGEAHVIGYYHSHPVGEAVPSAADRAMASGDGLVWAIVAQGEVRFWRDGAAGFEALSYSVVDG